MGESLATQMPVRVMNVPGMVSIFVGSCILGPEIGISFFLISVSFSDLIVAKIIPVKQLAV